jgi:hypothetical protein
MFLVCLTTDACSLQMLKGHEATGSAAKDNVNPACNSIIYTKSFRRYSYV